MRQRLRDILLAVSLATILLAFAGALLYLSLDVLGGGPAGTLDTVTVSVLGGALFGLIKDNVHKNSTTPEPGDHGQIPSTLEIGKPMMFKPNLGHPSNPFVGMIVRVKDTESKHRPDQFGLMNLWNGDVWAVKDKGPLERYIQENFWSVEKLDRVRIDA